MLNHFTTLHVENAPSGVYLQVQIIHSLMTDPGDDETTYMDHHNPHRKDDITSSACIWVSSSCVTTSTSIGSYQNCEELTSDQTCYYPIEPHPN
jgi:hypothetical protein